MVVVRDGRPVGRVITSPPEVAVEVLSPEDRAVDVQDKIDDYLEFGIPVVWLIDPERQRAWIHGKGVPVRHRAESSAILLGTWKFL